MSRRVQGTANSKASNKYFCRNHGTNMKRFDEVSDCMDPKIWQLGFRWKSEQRGISSSRLSFPDDVVILQKPRFKIEI